MNNHIVPAVPGQAADSKVGQGGQELGLKNEIAVLSCVKQQKWIRESEVSLLTGMSDYSVGMVSRRLEKRGEIYRDRAKGNSGYFLRLKATGAARVDGQSGKDVDIPVTWAHDAMAIQSLFYLSRTLECDFQTESCLRQEKKSGKLPDGLLYKGSISNYFFFEQERAKKSGPKLKFQTDNICCLAQKGVISYIAYPYPPEFCGNIKHEANQTRSIRAHLPKKLEHLVKFVRCHFNSLIAYENMHVDHFEIIDLPDVKENTKPAEVIPAPVEIEQEPVEEAKIVWNGNYIHNEANHVQISATATVNDSVFFEGEFECINKTEFIFKESGAISAENTSVNMNFSDFVNFHRAEVEKNIRGDLKMQADFGISDKK